MKSLCWTHGLLLFVSEGNGGNLSTNLEMITNRSRTVTNSFCVYLELDGKLCPLASLCVTNLALRYIYVINVGDLSLNYCYLVLSRTIEQAFAHHRIY